MIYCDGDSYMNGSTRAEIKSYKTLSYLMAEKFDTRLVRRCQSARSNQEIYSDLIRNINNGLITSDDKVLIGWTHIERGGQLISHHPYESPLRHLDEDDGLAKIHMFNQKNITYVPGPGKYKKERYLTSLVKSPLDPNQVVVRDFSNWWVAFYNLETLFQRIFAAQELLKARNIDYRFYINTNPSMLYFLHELKYFNMDVLDESKIFNLSVPMELPASLLEYLSKGPNLYIMSTHNEASNFDYFTLNWTVETLPKTLATTWFLQDRNHRMIPDRVHVNLDGHRIMADLIYDWWHDSSKDLKHYIDSTLTEIDANKIYNIDSRAEVFYNIATTIENYDHWNVPTFKQVFIRQAKHDAEFIYEDQMD